MKKSTKKNLMIVGGVAVLGIAGYFIYQKFLKKPERVAALGRMGMRQLGWYY